MTLYSVRDIHDARCSLIIRVMFNMLMIVIYSNLLLQDPPSIWNMPYRYVAPDYNILFAAVQISRYLLKAALPFLFCACFD